MATALRRAQTHLSLQVLILVTILLPAFTCPGIVTNEVNVDCEDDTKMAGSKIRPTTPVIEYFKEHEVSEKESRLALEALDLDQLTKVPAWCDECGIDKIHFCRSAAFINDHCCCEHRHAREKLSWIPHTCYLGKERCQPHTSSCSKYREIRECCCDRLLIGEYKARFSAGSRTCKPSQAASWILSVVWMTIGAIHLYS
ncbi:uncharacterized protein LOC131677799 isoform X1 [Topomyia yanbarensis]|uniref:uncharacterized protein LOC131677799 isoform X1 n=1 Tax=Topomyia yanbarensis TaxID=2498891 RepID=UPI00273AAACB|nr:uncharacterized protein LOC131677799 isoform X1 [Topomyia yanbarensis]